MNTFKCALVRLGFYTGLATLSHVAAAQPSLATFDSDTYLSCAAKALAAQTASAMPSEGGQPSQADRLVPTQQSLTELISLARDRQRIDPYVPFDEMHQFLTGVCYAQVRR